MLLKDDIQDIENSILEDIADLGFLVQCMNIYNDKNLSLKEADQRVKELKIKLAIVKS